MFKPVSTQADFRKIEDAVQKIWKERRIFTKIKAARRGAELFVCEDIPISASSKPTLSDSVTWTYKDAILRYHTMRGKNVLRRGAWLAHGLPVEIEAEKRLGLNTRDEIETVGLDRFAEACRLAAFHYTYEWEKTTDKFGYWIDWNEAFGTHTNTYIESVWSILKGFWDKGLIAYKEAVVPYCPRCGTPLSYLEIEHMIETEPASAYFVRLPVVDESGTSLLVWSAHPWTLPACTAVAVQPDADYVIVERHMEEGGSERLILAKIHLEAVFSTASLSPQISFLPAESVKIISEFKGKKLRGRHYHPLFTAMLPGKPAHFVVLADDIPIQTGSGIHALIPAFNQTDLHIARRNDLAVSIPVQPDGMFSPEIRSWSGRTPAEVDLLIAEDLTRRGLVLRCDLIEQTRPICAYCRADVLDYLRPVWMLNTAELKEAISPYDEGSYWLPPELRARVNSLADSSSEWVLGHERFYGTPMPIWCDDNGEAVMVGSLAELAELAECDPAIIDPHRPAIDGITFTNKKSGKLMRRVPHLVDLWFDLGAMPAAQYHYPFEAKNTFAKRFPLHLVYARLEGAQRWLHALQTVSSASFKQPAFYSALGVGQVLDSENQPLENEDVFLKEYLDNDSADALRWFWLSSAPAGGVYPFTSEKPAETWNPVLQNLWKAYVFFVTFANLRGWHPQQGGANTDHSSPDALHAALDRWLISYLNETMRNIDKAYDSYDLFNVANLLEEYVRCLSEWYLPRTQHRFWMSASDADEKAAFTALYKSLSTLCCLFAPIAPFSMEDIYQNLASQDQVEGYESVHLAPWPAWDASLIDEELNRAMRLIVHLAELGLAAVDKAELKPGRTFREAIFTLRRPYEADLVHTYAALLKDALHVKQVRTQISPHDGFELVESQYSLFVSPAGQYQVMLTAEPVRPPTAADTPAVLIQQILELRSRGGYALTVPIRVYLSASKALTESILEQDSEIMRATLAVEITAGEPPPQSASSGFLLANEMITLGIEMVKQKPVF